MTTDYVLFIHGVNTREQLTNPHYADGLFANIQAQLASASSSLHLQKIVLYWGDVAKEQEELLKQTYQQAPTWQQFWFRNVRETLLLQFIGDVSLYISRYVGARIVETLKDQVTQALRACQPNDRLHLVAHSLGTVILFDLLFSSRWDPPEAPGHDSVEQIRGLIYGVNPNPMQGIRIASVHTMGAPLGFFSLMDVDPSEQNHPYATHDITPRLQLLLQSLVQERAGVPLPWWNFAHPGDPLAYPLIWLLYEMVDTERRYLAVHDQITQPTGVFQRVMGLLQQSMLPLVNSSSAHLSYFVSQEVATLIARAISESAKAPSSPHML